MMKRAGPWSPPKAGIQSSSDWGNKVHPPTPRWFLRLQKDLSCAERAPVTFGGTALAGEVTSSCPGEPPQLQNCLPAPPQNLGTVCCCILSISHALGKHGKLQSIGNCSHLPWGCCGMRGCTDSTSLTWAHLSTGSVWSEGQELSRDTLRCPGGRRGGWVSAGAGKLQYRVRVPGLSYCLSSSTGLLCHLGMYNCSAWAWPGAAREQSPAQLHHPGLAVPHQSPGTPREWLLPAGTVCAVMWNWVHWFGLEWVC